MKTHLKLTASDGHKFGAYRVDPAGTPKGGIVVIQEIFGVNRHIRSVADRFAALGYVAIAPALLIALKRGSKAAIRRKKYRAQGALPPIHQCRPGCWTSLPHARRSLTSARSRSPASASAER
jgi:dienelactone hydrolase